MQLSIIIVNYNVKYFLELCLSSIQKACEYIDAEIIVVDNNSTDGSKAFLENKFTWVQFIWNKENIGFAKANNQALVIAKGEFVLFLNPDTIVPEDCFEKCLAFFKTHSDAGALGIRMIDGSGNFLKESKRAFPSPLTSLFKLTGLTKLFPKSRILGKYHLGNLSEKNNHIVDVLAGAFMMLPKLVLNQIGSFDDSFFMYGEDIDLSYRIQKAKYKNYYFSESTIIHFKGESTKKGSLNYVRMFYGAMILFVKKHYSGNRAGIFNFLIQIAIFFRGLLSLIGKFLQQIGLPLLDAFSIFFSFWCIKYFWSTYIRKTVNYSPNMLIIAFPVFSIIFLIASYYSGLYDKGFKQSQLNRSTISASLILLSSYALLPEDLRFSRGILVFGIAMAFILMSIIRWLFVKWKLIAFEDDEKKQAIVVSTENTFKSITELMHKNNMAERILGRVNNIETNSTKVLGNVQQLNTLIKTYHIKEVIFCQICLTFKDIINTIQQLPTSVSNKFYVVGSNSIVSSDNKNYTGNLVTNQSKYNITNTVNIRNKNLFDFITSLFFLISFPIHLIAQKKPTNFFKNTLAVLLRKKTWVGYATTSAILPEIKHGILTSTCLPQALNTLPLESLQLSDDWYASSYSISSDFKKLVTGYKYLCY